MKCFNCKKQLDKDFCVCNKCNDVVCPDCSKQNHHLCPTCYNPTHFVS